MHWVPCSPWKIQKPQNAPTCNCHRSAAPVAALKSILDLADDQITGKDLSVAFEVACLAPTLVSSSFEPGWAASVSAGAVEELLEMLVEGADSVNKWFLEASRFWSTELLQIFFQVAQCNSLDIDVDLALSLASHYGKIPSMEFLVDGSGTSAIGALLVAAEHGSLAILDCIACSEDGLVILELRSFMQEHWSEEAYAKGVRIGQEHFVDLVRIFERGEMPVRLRDLPRALVVAIGYLPFV